MNNIVNSNAQLVPDNIEPTVMAQIETIKQSAEKVDKALAAAKKAKESADATSQITAGWSFTGSEKKKAIEALQKSCLELATGIQDGADAQKEMFDNLQKISVATTTLFRIGTSSIATTTLVINTIELGLKTASKQKISEQAKESLMKLLQQLKAQENLFNKVEKCVFRCKELEKDVSTLKGTENAQSDELSIKGLTIKMSEKYDALLEKINNKANITRTEAVGDAKSYFDTKIAEEVARTNEAYDTKGTASLIANHSEEAISKAKNEICGQLSKDKAMLLKKNSVLKLWLWVFGFVSFINIILTVFMFM